MRIYTHHTYTPQTHTHVHTYSRKVKVLHYISVGVQRKREAGPRSKVTIAKHNGNSIEESSKSAYSLCGKANRVT